MRDEQCDTIAKERILSEIQRVTRDLGTHVSLDKFLEITGMSEHQILGQYWARWNDALAQAGAPTVAFLRPRTDPTVAIGAFAQLVERLEKWPTDRELILERRTDAAFPSLKVIRRLRSEPSFASRVAAHCEGVEGLSIALSIAEGRALAEATDAPVVGRMAVAGYVYMMRSGTAGNSPSCNR